MARGDIPRIMWGTSFANQLDVGYPLDESNAWSETQVGSEYVQAPSGETDAWITGTVYFLAGAARWIPTVDGTTPAGDAITGWDGATGWRAFLEWARDANEFQFIPDKGVPGTFILSRLVEPIGGVPGLERTDFTRRVEIVIRNNTSAYDGY